MVHLSKAGSNMTTLLRFFLGLVSLSSVMAKANPWTPGAYLRPFEQQGNNTHVLDPGEYTEEYCDMLLSGPQMPTADQVPWFCVCSRCKGTVGPKGELGTRGLPGRPGSSGRRGLTGFIGSPGFPGRPGVKGGKGDLGLKGDRGLEGRMGGKGERGFKGDKGERGFEGPAGDEGLRGEEGVCPDACDEVMGYPGQQGLPGSVGPRGLVGPMGPTAVKGHKGDTGAVGAPGEPGSMGLKGDQGEEAVCNHTDGARGAQGLPGDKGGKGDLGEMGGQGLKGDMGLKGDIGAIGDMGPPGPCTPGIHSSFSAGLMTPFPQPDTPVVFSRVLYNIQQHYDPLSGIYTAPVNGTYVFSYHCTAYLRVLIMGLFHNFSPVVKTTVTSHIGTAAHQVILHLDMDDGVWIQVKNTLTNGMYSVNEASSTFSGFLLHPDRCDMPESRREVPVFIKGPPPTYSWGGESTTASPGSG